MPVTEQNPPSAIRHPQSGGEVVVSVRGLTKVFKDFWNRPKARAVDNVDFEVRQGEVFGLLGPNGSGKSTTVKLMLGLLYPTKGHIEVFGHSPRHVQTKSRIGYLPEESYLYRYLNSRETLDFFGNLFHLPKAERHRRTEQLLEMVGLGKTQTRVIGEFSKGMQRRIGLAQALINDPDLVILDEPTAGLDPIGCREVKDLILALARRGKTVILSSHLLADVEDVCDRVVIYYGGKIQAMGTLKELLATPDTLRITTPVLPRAAGASGRRRNERRDFGRPRGAVSAGGRPGTAAGHGKNPGPAGLAGICPAGGQATDHPVGGTRRERAKA
ncbi:MAG: ABC transporter ATP-binding protein [Verrucomicrobiota bacterium]